MVTEICVAAGLPTPLNVPRLEDVVVEMNVGTMVMVAQVMVHKPSAIALPEEGTAGLRLVKQ